MSKINFGEWEAVINDNFMLMSKDIYLFRRTPQGKQVLDSSGTIHTIKEGEAPKDSLYFARLEPEQVQALADGLSESGVKTESNYKIEGLLDATKKHLFDMRAIVYKHEGLMFEADVKERPKS